jgi:hypothetical protein
MPAMTFLWVDPLSDDSRKHRTFLVIGVFQQPAKDGIGAFTMNAPRLDDEPDFTGVIYSERKWSCNHS